MFSDIAWPITQVREPALALQSLNRLRLHSGTIGGPFGEPVSLPARNRALRDKVGTRHPQSARSSSSSASESSLL